MAVKNKGMTCGKYITFDEAVNPEIFKIFKELSEYHDFLVELDNQFARETFRDIEIDKKINKFQGSVTNKKDIREGEKSEIKFEHRLLKTFDQRTSKM